MKIRKPLLMVAGFLLVASSADARGFRPGMMPNGFAARCEACHMSPAGRDARNAFGLEVEKLVTAGGREVFWGPALALLDSDGDGFTNGQELGDPEGVWVSGETPAGSRALAANPGFATSVPPSPGQVAVLNVQIDPAVDDLTVEVSRAIGGRASDYMWSGTTDDDGTASITINATGDPQFFRIGANGYYRARTVDSTGAVVGTWPAFAVRGGLALDVALASGASASIAPFSGSPLAASKPVIGGTTLASAPRLEAPLFSVSARANGFDIVSDNTNDVNGGDFTMFTVGDVDVAGVRVNGTEVDLNTLDPGVLAFSAADPIGSINVDLASGSASNVILRGLVLDGNDLPFAEVTVRPGQAVSADQVRLHQNFPNPFNPTTQLRYDLSSESQVRLTVLNSLGQEIAQLVNDHQPAGTYSFTWDAAGYSSGTYYLELTTANQKFVRKMLLVK